MGLNAKVEQWRSAGLIDGATARKILDFEGSRSRPKTLYAVGAMGALAVALGVLALIASNWDAIPVPVKLGSLFAICLAFASVVVSTHKGTSFGALWLREIALVLYGAATLGGYALIGQIYHLKGDLSETLGIWCLVTTPLFWQARSRYVASLWTTAAVGILIFFFISHTNWFDSRTQAILIRAGLPLIPLLLLAFAQELWFEKEAANFADVFYRVGGLSLLGVASFGQIIWHTGRLYSNEEGLLVSFAIEAVAVALFLWRRKSLGRWNLWEAILLVYCVGTPHLPLVFDLRSELFGVLGFLGLWALVARVAYVRQDGLLFNLATGILGARFFVVYLQQIGGFLGTGLGLVGGGLVLMGLTWGWMKKSRTFTRGWKDTGGDR